MRSTGAPTQEDVFALQTGTDESMVSVEDKHFFDIAGYLVLDNLLTEDQVAESQQAVAESAIAATESSPTLPHGTGVRQLVNVVELGGVLEDGMALPSVTSYVRQFVWGRQYRLIGSRAVFTEPGVHGRLTQGGSGRSPRYARYRCFGDGQFRCLMVTSLIALRTSNDGSFCVVPASHKANLAHPYENTELEQVPPLREIRLPAGSAVLFAQSLSHGFKTPRRESRAWLSYQYGPSYMLNWPGCKPSAELLNRTADDSAKSHLLREPYYHPEE